MSVTFFQVDFQVANLLIEGHFPASTYRTWLYLMKLDPFGDRKRPMPEFEDIATDLNFSKASARRAVNQLIEFGIITLSSGKAFQSQIQNFKTGLVKAGKNIRKRFFCGDHKCESGSKNDNSVSQLVLNLENNLQICKNQSLESLSPKDSKFPQTLQTKIQTSQTEIGGDGKNIFSSSKAKPDPSGTDDLVKPNFELGLKNLVIEEDQEKTSLDTEPAKSGADSCSLPKAKPKPKNPALEKSSANVISKATKSNTEISQELITRLEQCEIPLDDRVRKAINRHHISQAYGAITHIENTWESIIDPKAIFLLQLPKQPIEQVHPSQAKSVQENVERIKRETAEYEALRSQPGYREESKRKWAEACKNLPWRKKAKTKAELRNSTT